MRGAVSALPPSQQPALMSRRPGERGKRRLPPAASPSSRDRKAALFPTQLHDVEEAAGLGRKHIQAGGWSGCQSRPALGAERRGAARRRRPLGRLTRPGSRGAAGPLGGGARPAGLCGRRLRPPLGPSASAAQPRPAAPRPPRRGGARSAGRHGTARHSTARPSPRRGNALPPRLASLREPPPPPPQRRRRAAPGPASSLSSARRAGNASAPRGSPVRGGWAGLRSASFPCPPSLRHRRSAAPPPARRPQRPPSLAPDTKGTRSHRRPAPPRLAEPPRAPPAPHRGGGAAGEPKRGPRRARRAPPCCGGCSAPRSAEPGRGRRQMAALRERPRPPANLPRAPAQPRRFCPFTPPKSCPARTASGTCLAPFRAQQGLWSRHTDNASRPGRWRAVTFATLHRRGNDSGRQLMGELQLECGVWRSGPARLLQTGFTGYRGEKVPKHILRTDGACLCRGRV